MVVADGHNGAFDCPLLERGDIILGVQSIRKVCDCFFMRFLLSTCRVIVVPISCSKIKGMFIFLKSIPP